MKNPTSQFKRTLFRILAAVILLLSFYGLACAWISFQSKREWLAEKTRLENLHEPLSLTDVVPAEIPDEQNLYMSPLFADMAGNPTERNTRLKREIEARGWHKIKTGKAEDGSVDLNLAASSLRTPEMSEMSAAEVVLSTLEKSGDIWKELEAAAARPAARFPIPYSGLYWALPLPHNSAVIRLSKVLGLRAAAYIEVGNGALAAKDIRLIVVLAESLATEPVVLSQLVRQSSLKIALRRIQEGMQRDLWSEAQYLAFERQLAPIDLPNGMTLALRGERGGFNDFWGRAAAADVSKANPLVCLLPLSFFYGEMAVFSRDMQKQIGTLKQAGEGGLTKFPLSYEKPSKIERFRHYFAHLGTPENGWEKIVAETLCIQARVDMARIACSLKRYRHEHGKYPETLEALVPVEMEMLPRDVVGGESYSYRNENGDLILRSAAQKQGSGDRDTCWIWRG